MRAFLALQPDEEARRAILEVLPDAGDAVRPTDMADWHLTVRFLGEVREEAVASLREVLARELPTIASNVVRLGPATAIGIGARVLFVPAHGAEQLAARIDELLAAAGLDDEVASRAHPFTGHVTIARSRGRSRLPGALAGRPVAASWTPTEVSLVASRLEPERAVHQVVDRFPLRRPSA